MAEPQGGFRSAGCGNQRAARQGWLLGRHGPRQGTPVASWGSLGPAPARGEKWLPSRSQGLPWGVTSVPFSWCGGRGSRLCPLAGNETPFGPIWTRARLPTFLLARRFGGVPPPPTALPGLPSLLPNGLGGTATLPSEDLRLLQPRSLCAGDAASAVRPSVEGCTGTRLCAGAPGGGQEATPPSSDPGRPES